MLGSVLFYKHEHFSHDRFDLHPVLLREREQSFFRLNQIRAVFNHELDFRDAISKVGFVQIDVKAVFLIFATRGHDRCERFEIRQLERGRERSTRKSCSFRMRSE